MADKLTDEAKVLPAHAGVILAEYIFKDTSKSITRTCGGDPVKAEKKTGKKRYYPHMRG